MWPGDGKEAKQPRTQAPHNTKEIILQVKISACLSAGWKPECWGITVHLHWIKPAAALKTILLFFNTSEAAVLLCPSSAPQPPVTKKVSKHNPTLSNLLSTLLSQPCLWSPRSSHHRDRQQHGQLPFGTSALDEPYRHCRAPSKTLLWRRTLKGGLPKSLADKAQLLRVACFEAGWFR